MTKQRTQDLPFFRPRLLDQIIARLSHDQPVLIVGGPKMGKSSLLAKLKTRAPNLAVEDDCSPEDAIEHIKMRTPICMTVGVSHYGQLKQYRQGCFWVPLTNLTPKMLETTLSEGHIAWAVTVGHPYLSDQHRQQRELLDDHTFRARCSALLSAHPKEKSILDRLNRMATTLDPAERYQSLRAAAISDLKPRLDWLVCAGLVTRLIHGDRPGVTSVPIW